ncbi:MAG TPA: GAF and ANTAR domain-containing protein [Jatrophihabitans sp.]
MSSRTTDDHGDTPADLTTALSRLAEALGAEQGELDLQAVLRLAVGAVAHADHVGLSLVETGEPPRSLAASGPVPSQVDAVQHRLDEGPCLQAIDRDELVAADDLSSDRTWPRFAAEVTAVTTVRSLFAARMALDDDRSAALNFYADRPDAFDDADFATGTVLAGLISTAIQRDAATRKVEDLEAALDSARTIGTAVGVLMAKRLLTREQAFDQLRAASEHLHTTLRAVAQQVAETGELPV